MRRLSSTCRARLLGDDCLVGLDRLAQQPDVLERVLDAVERLALGGGVLRVCGGHAAASLGPRA
jgi:hypothetical protein